MSAKPSTIEDREVAALPSDNKPDLHPDLIRLCMAHDRLKAAQAKVDLHVGPYAGPEWKSLTDAYATAKADLDAEFRRIHGSER